MRPHDPIAASGGDPHLAGAGRGRPNMPRRRARRPPPPAADQATWRRAPRTAGLRKWRLGPSSLVIDPPRRTVARPAGQTCHPPERTQAGAVNPAKTHGACADAQAPTPMGAGTRRASMARMPIQSALTRPRRPGPRRGCGAIHPTRTARHRQTRRGRRDLYENTPSMGQSNRCIAITRWRARRGTAALMRSRARGKKQALLASVIWRRGQG